MSTTAPSERTLRMSVAKTGFLLERLGQDCAPLQFLRELTQNSIEAILNTPDQKGQIIWDVDWDHYSLSDSFKLCIIDSGSGMTGEEMARYINQLSSSVHEQSHYGNFGVGAKIAAATRNHEGLVYLSWKDGIGHTIQLWRDPDTDEYGLRQMQLPNGKYAHWATIEDTVKPDAIKTHGTKVVLLGNEPGADTMQPPPGTPSPSMWIGRYLNTRYFDFPKGVTIKAREGWEFPRQDSDRNHLRTIVGQRHYLEQHAASSGTEQLSSAKAHWWILKDEKALSSNSGWIASSGHMAALLRDEDAVGELYEMVSGRAAVARLQMFGVIFGYRQVVIYVEPDQQAGSLMPNTARTQLLLAGEPLPWADWGAEFRAKLPQAINDLMEEITAGITATDHKQAIKERLRQIRELFRLSRYRPTPKGDKLVDDERRSGGGAAPSDTEPDTDATTSKSGGGSRGGRGRNIYALFLADDGTPADEVNADIEPDVKWVTVADGTRDQGFLEDRAAKFMLEQNLLQINGDFRGFTDMIDRWCKFYGHVPSAKPEVVDAVREWFEQALIETILGVQSLKDSREWSIGDIATALSEEALTSTVMPRYHVDVAVRRALGSKLGTLKEKVV